MAFQQDSLTPTDGQITMRRPGLGEAAAAARELLRALPDLARRLASPGDPAHPRVVSIDRKSGRSYSRLQLLDALANVAEGTAYLNRLAPLLTALDKGRIDAPLAADAAVILSPHETRKIGMKLQSGLRDVLSSLNAGGGPAGQPSAPLVQSVKALQPLVDTVDTFRLACFGPHRRRMVTHVLAAVNEAFAGDGEIILSPAVETILRGNVIAGAAQHPATDEPSMARR